MKRWLSILVVICLVGCQSNPPPAKSEHVLRMNISREPPTMDPRKGSEWIGSSMHFLLFEGLMRLNPNGTLTPAQARSVEISDDRKTYTFHLRGTHWSDGSMVTAKDFELAWKKIVDPQFGATGSYLFYPIKNVEKFKNGEVSIDQIGISSKDDMTFVVELEQPTPYFLDLISFCIFFPVNHQVDEQNRDWMMEASSQFVSNGPFTLKTWKHNQEIVLQKNNHYWEAPLIDLNQISVSMIGDENTALSMYQNGELDVIGMVISPIPTEVLHQLYEQGVVKKQPAPASTIITFNTSKFPFTNKHIRKALSYAIDRSQIVNNITELGEEAATNIIPACLRTDSPRSYFQDHDLIQAKKELALGLKELGIQTFPKVILEYSSNTMKHQLAQVVQEQWKNGLGIDIEIQKCDHQLLLQRLIKRAYDLATISWFAQYKDPMSIFERFKYKKSAKNYPDWENPEYVRLMDQSAHDVEPERRAETFSRAEALLLEEMPFAPLYHWQTAFMMKDHVFFKDLEPSGCFDYSRMMIKE